MPAKPTTIDEYIAACPEPVRPVLEEIRRAILRALPGAEERVRYGMPAVMFDGRHAIHFAAWKKHIGVYPVYRSEDPLEAEIEPYRDGKDGLKFSLDRPVPYALIERIVRLLAAHHGAVSRAPGALFERGPRDGAVVVFPRWGGGVAVDGGVSGAGVVDGASGKARSVDASDICRMGPVIACKAGSARGC